MIHLNQQELTLSKIYPKCTNNRRTRAFSADGFVLPCCWLDTWYNRDHKIYGKLFDDSLHIDCNNSIDNIEYSDIWLEFLYLIDTNSDKLDTCKMMCNNNERNPIRDRIREEHGE